MASKASEILQFCKDRGVDESFDFTQNYHVGRFSDAAASLATPIFSGSYEDCINYIVKNPDPDFVVYDDSGRMRPTQPAIGPGQSSTQVDQPQTFDHFSTMSQYI